MNKLKKIWYKLLCKLGGHQHRVYGHVEEKEGTEYYYTCVVCGEHFWDYAVKLKITVNPDKDFDWLNV